MKLAHDLNEQELEYVEQMARSLLPKYSGDAGMALNQACLVLKVEYPRHGGVTRLFSEMKQRLDASGPLDMVAATLDMAVIDGVLSGDAPARVAEVLGVDLLDVADVLARYVRASMEKP